MKSPRLFLALFLLLSFIACAGMISSEKSSAQTKTSAPKFTAADLKKLRWIEGNWRGTGIDQPPFFERYRFEGDTTLAVDSFEDEKLSKVTDTTYFRLEDGEFGGGNEGARYAAVKIDDNSIIFEPRIKVRNGFIWKRESKDAWTAVIQWPASKDRPARERTYNMIRWPKE